MFQEGDILCSKYQLKRRFDGGGFSSVWLARDLKAQEDFALKIYYDIEDMQSFRNGFKLVYKLAHSNIFTPLAYDVHEGVPFLVMTYLPNGSASSRIGKMTENEIWKFVHDVAAGLAYLHDTKAIVHQDIKPGNILIDDDGNYMITDFDISTKQKGTERMTARQVEEMQDFNYGAGTPDYMGAERWPDKNEGYVPSSIPMQASDIWSLGATLFQIMEGYVPFGETGGAYQRNLCRKVNLRHRKDDAIPKISGKYSKELKKLVRMCLAKDTWNRPSAKQIAECALNHKAPILHVDHKRWKLYGVGGGIAAVLLALVISLTKGHKSTDSIVETQDSLYSVFINNASNIIMEQSEMAHRDVNHNFDLDRIAEAFRLREQADTLNNVTDSTKTKGITLWSESQKILNQEYHRLDSLEQYYRRMDATEAALSFARQRFELEKYVTNK